MKKAHFPSQLLKVEELWVAFSQLVAKVVLVAAVQCVRLKLAAPQCNLNFEQLRVSYIHRCYLRKAMRMKFTAVLEVEEL